MTWIQNVLNALESGLWKFVKIVHSSNHDYPYHDYVEIDNSQGGTTLKGMYVVGTNNVNAHGDQKKMFVSKHANIWCGTTDTKIRFNHSDNVEITLPFKAVDSIEETWHYEKEFHTNISVVYYEVADEDILRMYFEGVLPQEARDAE